MSKSINDYAMIGDGQTAALVSREASIDWLCWPRFDSDACFAALLGDPSHGCWSMAPEADGSESTRRYGGETLILETDFTTTTGKVRITDFMPVRDGHPSALVRIVQGLEGHVAVRSTLRVRFDYGSIAPWFNRTGDAFVGKVGPDLVVLRSGVAFSHENESLSARFTIATGDRIAFTLQHGSSTGPVPPTLDADELLTDTKRWWLDWIGRFTHDTEWSGFLRRSLIVLKALSYFPTGGVVAAPTTSLPERSGGRLNWDYRYCWLRDATFTLTALLNAGFKHEAQAWLHWLLRAVAGNPDKIRVAYRVDGDRHLQEWKVPWLPGFNSAKPVRIGNAAATQRQLDIYGEVLDVAHIAERAGLERNEWEADVELRLVLRVAEIWRQPDQGLWESRGTPRHYVYSKVMAWVAIDRFLKMRAARTGYERELLAVLAALRDAIHEEICRKGFSRKRNSFVSHYYSHRLDASLLLLPLVGFLPVDDPRMAGTIAAIEAELLEDGLVRRHKASRLGREEGAFIACSCWLADCMVMQQRAGEARALLGRVIARANDVGLLSEEYHAREGRLAGNFPQALSHLAFVNSVLGLSGPVIQRGGG
jgi:GH15 family glucan-1,4-alpha-glucosidase